MSDLTTAIKAAGFFASVLCLGGCDEQVTSNKTVQQTKAAEAAKSINFAENAEIDNIKRRLQLTADPGKYGFILLLNQAGQPILYEGVKGKVTSSGKRLTEPDRISSGWGSNGQAVLRAGASDEGPWGSSSAYLFYWNTEGVYRQWDGGYLYSDQPIRLRVEPLVVSVQSAAAK
ncbi:MAG: hypothetical protein KGL35_24770 [Bradyrhizobium sp.]|nr:hypothetical protein [Bradyrhizobium sp.]